MLPSQAPDLSNPMSWALVPGHDFTACTGMTCALDLQEEAERHSKCMGVGKSGAASGGCNNVSPHICFPQALSAGSEVTADPINLLDHFDIVCVPQLWKHQPLCGCTREEKSHQSTSPQCYSYKLNPAHRTLPGKVTFVAKHTCQS